MKKSPMRKLIEKLAQERAKKHDDIMAAIEAAHKEYPK